jgi:hypothetical protein
MNKNLTSTLCFLSLVLFYKTNTQAQVTLTKNYQLENAPVIGIFQGVTFKEGGFSGLFPIVGTEGKEFWTCSDRGVNVDAAKANPENCRPTHDKIFPFPTYSPKIHHIKIEGDKIQILQTISVKRPNGKPATGIINPTGLGSISDEFVLSDTVQDCANLQSKIIAKDTFGLDPEGIIVDKNGNFWLCEEGGASIWKLNSQGVLIKRYTPYANMPGVQAEDLQLDTAFKYRKTNRGFEGIAITPSGKIYAIIQSPLLYPTKAIGESSRIHRIIEIDPVTNKQRMFAYLNDGIVNQIKLKDWKIGDMAAINDSMFLVIEAASKGTTDVKRIYMININQATPIHSGLYNGKTLEALADSMGLASNAIKPVKKDLFADLIANGWPTNFEKAEGLAIIDNNTIAVCNDNDFGQTSSNQNGVISATAINSHLLTFKLSGNNMLKLNQPLPKKVISQKHK